MQINHGFQTCRILIKFTEATQSENKSILCVFLPVDVIFVSLAGLRKVHRFIRIRFGRGAKGCEYIRKSCSCRKGGFIILITASQPLRRVSRKHAWFEATLHPSAYCVHNTSDHI